MSLRIAYAAALRFLRKRSNVSQQQLAQAANPSYISRLESGTRSVTLDVSQEVAKALGVDPLTLLVLMHASERNQTPQEVLDHLQNDLNANGLLSDMIPSLSKKVEHPVVAAAGKLREQIKKLIAEGLSQAEIARQLGVSRQTVSNHVKKILD